MSSCPIMERKRKCIVGGKRGDNGLLYVCLMTWSDKQSRRPPAPHCLKALQNVSNIKEGNFDFAGGAMWGGGGHELGEWIMFS